MTGWWAMGIVVAACLALCPNYSRHHQRRAQVRRVRAEVATWLSAQSSGEGFPPTPLSAPTSHRLKRQRRTLMFGALYPNISVGPRSAA
jgi:hypothetical protein